MFKYFKRLFNCYDNNKILMGKIAIRDNRIKELLKEVNDAIHSKQTRKIYAFDLDGTLCTGKPRQGECVPIQSRIDRVNDLYKKGQVILIYTARHPEHYKETLAWLIKYNVYFHGLNLGRKPGADIYIDDRAMSDKEFFKDNLNDKII